MLAPAQAWRDRTWRRVRRTRRLLARAKGSPVLTPLTRRRMSTAVALASVGVPIRSDVALLFEGGPVFLGRRSAYIDAVTVLDVWEERMYAAQCDGRFVLDIGGHKGYFGAWALAQGAVHVLSYEPQVDNFVLAERARAANARSSSWELERAAVGDREGRVRLFTSAESWAHTLYATMIDAAGSEEVQMVPLGRLLERAVALHPGRDVVVKLNAEGAAGQILLPVEKEQLAPVVEVHLDHEPGSPYELDDLLRHLRGAGLDEVRSEDGRLYTVLRS